MNRNNLNLPASVITGEAGEIIEKAESSSNYDTIKREINKQKNVTGMSQVCLASDISAPEPESQPIVHNFQEVHLKVNEARHSFKRTHTYQP